MYCCYNSMLSFCHIRNFFINHQGMGGESGRHEPMCYFGKLVSHFILSVQELCIPLAFHFVLLFLWEVSLAKWWYNLAQFILFTFTLNQYFCTCKLLSLVAPEMKRGLKSDLPLANVVHVGSCRWGFNPCPL